MKILLFPDSSSGASAAEQIDGLTKAVNRLTNKVAAMEADNDDAAAMPPSPADRAKEPKKRVTIINGGEYRPPGWSRGQPTGKGIGSRPWIHRVGSTWEFPCSHANSLILHGLAAEAAPGTKLSEDPDALPAVPGGAPQS